jgi:hypothetical protein
MRRYRFLPIAFLLVIAIVFVSATWKYEAPPMAGVQLLKQNVLYIGVDNPIWVTVAGAPASDVSVEVSYGTITATDHPGQYIISVSGGTSTSLMVYFMKNGVREQAGKFDFRVKRVPDPVTYVNAIRSDGVILKENLATITGIFTRMENFDFDCKFTPQSFSMSVIEDGEWKEYKATSPELTPEMKTALTKCEEEDKILFHNVATKGPDGTIRKVNAVVVTVK